MYNKVLTMIKQSNSELKNTCQKGPTRHAYAWQIGPFWQDTLVVWTILVE